MPDTAPCFAPNPDQDSSWHGWSELNRYDLLRSQGANSGAFVSSPNQRYGFTQRWAFISKRGKVPDDSTLTGTRSDKAASKAFSTRTANSPASAICDVVSISNRSSGNEFSRVTCTRYSAISPKLRMISSTADG